MAILESMDAVIAGDEVRLRLWDEADETAIAAILERSREAFSDWLPELTNDLVDIPGFIRRVSEASECCSRPQGRVHPCRYRRARSELATNEDSDGSGDDVDQTSAVARGFGSLPYAGTPSRRASGSFRWPRLGRSALFRPSGGGLP